MVPGWLAPVIIIPILLAVLGVISEKVYRNWRDKKLSKMLEETARTARHALGAAHLLTLAHEPSPP